MVPPLRRVAAMASAAAASEDATRRAIEHAAAVEGMLTAANMRAAAAELRLEVDDDATARFL